jgi:hypothetical protein
MTKIWLHVKTGVEVTAFFAGPIVFVVAYPGDFVHSTGIMLAVISVGIGMATWLFVTLVLEGGLHRAAFPVRPARRDLPLPLATGLVTALLIWLVAPLLPLLSIVLGVYVASLIASSRTVRSRPVSALPGRRRIPRRAWVLAAAAILIGGCTASITPSQSLATHRVRAGANVPVEEPVLAGRLLAGTLVSIDSVQFAPDGRTVFLSSARGVCQALWSANATLTQPDVLTVALRIGARACLPAADPAVAHYFGAMVTLDVPVDLTHPPHVVDASNGDIVLPEPWLQ